jgi:hypothetical protein
MHFKCSIFLANPVRKALFWLQSFHTWENRFTKQLSIMFKK